MILTPDVREKLIALAKSRAEPVVNCFAASIPPAHLLSDLPREGLYALIAVLAESADRHLLHQVVSDEPAAGPPPVPPVLLRLRRLHAEYVRYRSGGIAVEDIPLNVRAGETAYQRDSWQRRQQREAGRVA